jgi:site-specific DNA-methyltransferase (adenine-specific)
MSSKRFVVNKACTLYCGDNVEVMRREIADNSVQLTVTSPPYDNLRKYSGFAWDFEAVARELFRVTKPGGVVVWVVADATVNGSETGTSFRQALYFKECGFNLHDTMIYQKAGTGACGSNYAYWSCWEYMFVLSKGRPGAINLIEDVKNTSSGTRSGGRIGKNGEQKEKGKLRFVKEFSRRTNIWRYTVGAFNSDDKTKHPAPFPEQLATDHILSWSNPGDLVLDPFLGSGTTGKRALVNSRRFVGIEISSEYVQLALQRIKRGIKK